MYRSLFISFIVLATLLVSCNTGKIKFTHKKKFTEREVSAKQTPDEFISENVTSKPKGFLIASDQEHTESDGPNAVSHSERLSFDDIRLENARFDLEPSDTICQPKKKQKYSGDEIAVRSMKSAKISIFMMSFFIISLGLGLIISLTFLIIAIARFVKAKHSCDLTNVGYNALNIAKRRIALATLLIIFVPIAVALAIYLVAVFIGGAISLGSLFLLSSFSLSGFNISW